MKGTVLLSLLALLLFIKSSQAAVRRRTQVDYSEESDEHQLGLSDGSNNAKPYNQDRMQGARRLRAAWDGKCSEHCVPRPFEAKDHCPLNSEIYEEITPYDECYVPDFYTSGITAVNGAIIRCCNPPKFEPTTMDPNKLPSEFKGEDACMKFAQIQDDPKIVNGGMCYALVERPTSTSEPDANPCQPGYSLHITCDRDPESCEIIAMWEIYPIWREYCCYGNEIESRQLPDRKCYQADNCTCYEFLFDEKCNFKEGNNIFVRDAEYCYYPRE